MSIEREDPDGRSDPQSGVRTEIASLETRLIRWMVGTVLATATLTFAILRFLDGALP